MNRPNRSLPANRRFPGSFVPLVLQRRNLLDLRQLGLVVGLWILGAGCILTLSTSDVLGRMGVVDQRCTLVALICIVLLPLVRPIAAPLALDWNRRR